MGASNNIRWIQAWQDDEILDFHQLQTNTMLIASWKSLKVRQGASVFVPLCGKSLDMLWLADQGFEVVGVELSPIAVHDFFESNHLTPTRSQSGPFTIWNAGSITILCGDFFSLKRKMLGNIDYIYDRASLTCLDQSVRTRYVNKVRALCNVPMLLLTTEECSNELNGDKHIIDEEVQSLYQKDYRILLDRTKALFPFGSPTELTQKAYVIHPRNAS